MKKLTIKQMNALVDFLIDCNQDYEDCYSEKAVNLSLKVLGYDGEFHYDPFEDAMRFEGGLLMEEEE